MSFETTRENLIAGHVRHHENEKRKSVKVRQVGQDDKLGEQPGAIVGRSVFSKIVRFFKRK